MRLTATSYAVLSSVSLLALFAASPAAAAASTPAPATAPAAETGAYNALDEIVVTAQRTSQSLQDVPIAITAFTAQSLAAQQINNSSDLQLTLPNVVFTKGNFTGGNFTIRGVGDLCVGVSCDSATAIHVNDLPLFGTRIFETDYFDLERVEVLRGPQGTLFGRNATAGVVNFITAKPDLKAFHANAEGEYGKFNDIRVKGMINVPLSDTLGVRFAGTYLKRDGYTQNLYNNTNIDGRDEYAVRGSVRWRPDSSTTVDLMGYYFHEKDSRLRNQKQLCQRDPTGVLGCLPGRLANDTTNANSTLASIFASQQFLGAPAIFGALAPALKPLAIANLYGPDAFTGAINPTDPRKVYTAYKPRYFADEIQAEAKIEHDFGKVKLGASGLYQRNTVDSSQDYDLAINNPAGFVAGLTAASAYAAGLGPLGPLGAQIAPAVKALIPNGPNGPYCTSSVYDTTGTGAFGGRSTCAAVPLNYDRSVQYNDAYTGEVILTTQFDGSLNFLVGGIYNNVRTTENSYYVNAFGLDYASAVLGLAGTIGQQSGNAAAGIAPNPTFPSSYRASPYYRNNTNYAKLESYGLFGEAYWKATDRLKLTVGVRYNNDKKSISARTTLFSDANGGAVLVPYTATNITQAAGYANLDYDPGRTGNQLYDVRKVSFSEVTGRAVVDFKITDESLLYASYSRGYKSGGINPPLSPIFAVNEAFSPEFIDAFEVGSKNTFLDGRLRLNVAGFYYKYKSLQISRIVARTSVNDNVDAEIYGLEADAIIEPIRAFAVNLGFSYLKTKVSNDKFLSNPRDPSGGRSDAVIIKDITNASNCAVVPNVTGNAAGTNTLVGIVNTAGLGLNAPTAFPANSGINGATGAFGICSILSAAAAGNLAAVSPAFAPLQAFINGTLNGGAPGALPYTVLNEGVTTNLRGNQLPQSPKFKASAGAQYTIDLGSGGMTLVPRYDISITGNSTGSIFNGTADRIPSYFIQNAQVQLNGKDDRWFVRGFIQNIGNNNATTGLYVTDQSSGLFTNIFTLEPRRYGIAGGIHF